MSKAITINNARTQSIETAVEELSKRDSITMTEVREFMDDLVSQKIPTGEKKKFTDPNGDEQEYDVKIPISKIYKYKSDEIEILSRVEENILNNHDFTLDFTKDVKLSDWLKDLKDRSFFVAKEDVPKFVTWATRFARDIQNTCEKGEVAKSGLDTQNLQMQFNSVVKGCGKSYFIRQLVDGANELGIRARDEAPMPEIGRFGNTDLEARCLVLGYREHKPEVRVNEDVVMSVGRRESYPFEEKCKMKKTLQARAITIGSSNGFPYNKDDRSMTVIRCNSLKFQDYPEEIKKRASNVNAQNTTIYKLKSQISWISGFLDDLLEKNEFKSYINEDEQNPEIQETLRVLSSYEISRLLIEVLSVIDKSLLDNVSVAGLSKLYKKAEGQELTFNQRNKIAELLTILYSKGLIQKTNYETNDLYKSYNLFKLSFIRLQDLTKEGTVTALQEVENAQKTWDDIIALAEKYENDNPDDNPPKKEVTDEEVPFKADKESKLDDSWTVLDRYDEEGKYNKEGDQACVNKPLEGECKNRCDNRVHKQNYLFECDNIPLEEQCKMIWNLPESFRKCILWACKTGGKSIHVVTATNTPDYANSKMRQYIHGRINDMIFDGKADPSTYNAGRIARAPNATRHDKKHPKMHQTCYLFNMNAEKLDVSKFVKEFEEIEEEKKFFYRFKELNNQAYEKKGEGIHTLEELRKWNESHPSDAKRECIDFLEGNLKDWNRGVACVRELRLFGFSDDEIAFEGPVNDTWIAGAIKSARD